ncbi:MAG: Rieske (2Fe-2S) protein [Polyangiaceae bacterium]|jgi:nitrite reductase/ring-hydroxylating ferredoxin subunit|nr:Rieske (2Fe-2S) protein [Polyangiaceae bacterium]MBK8938480.1 Rieske (2Fe-2S) protein [Polyangiaceae bacterium]
MVDVPGPGQAARLPPFPQGWYCLAYSDELARGAVLNRRLGGKELLLFRTESGAISAMAPICPHLGAHMGHGGRVEGETLRCPFHAFRFAVDGTCVATGYGTTPPKVKASTWHATENHGAVLVWFDPDGRPPSFEVPTLDMRGFTHLKRRTYRLRGHPQDTTENSVDFGHLAVVHGYQELRTIKEVTTDGPYLTARYGMLRPVGLLGEALGGVSAEFTVHVRGLGHSFVEVVVPALGVETRNFVFATPVAEMELELHIACALRHLDATPGLKSPLRLAAKLGPLRRAIESFLMRQSFEAYRNDVEQDFVIWKHKQFVARPALALGDGPVLKYRRWAQQFYRPEDLGGAGDHPSRSMDCT